MFGTLVRKLRELKWKRHLPHGIFRQEKMPKAGTFSNSQARIFSNIRFAWSERSRWYTDNPSQSAIDQYQMSRVMTAFFNGVRMAEVDIAPTTFHYPLTRRTDASLSWHAPSAINLAVVFTFEAVPNAAPGEVHCRIRTRMWIANPKGQAPMHDLPYVLELHRGKIVFPDELKVGTKEFPNWKAFFERINDEARQFYLTHNRNKVQ